MEKTILKGSCLLNPLPVVLVTSRNGEGKVNVFTAAWVGTLCTHPPIISLSIRPERLSYEYIVETKECVINIPTDKLVKSVDYCGVVSGRKEDKIISQRFTLKDSSKVSVPYVNECLINLECKIINSIKLGTHEVFMCEVVSTTIDNILMDSSGKIDFRRANLISYCHGEYFTLNSNPLGSFGYSVNRKNLKWKKGGKHGSVKGRK